MKLFKVVCVFISTKTTQLWSEVAVEEPRQVVVEQTNFEFMYEHIVRIFPKEDVVIFLAFVSLAFLLRIFCGFTSESDEPQEETREPYKKGTRGKRSARGKSPTRRSARLLAKSQGKQF